MDTSTTPATAGVNRQPTPLVMQQIAILLDLDSLALSIDIDDWVGDEIMLNVVQRVRAAVTRLVSEQHAAIIDLERQISDLAADRAELTGILVGEADSWTTPRVLRAKLQREIEVLDEQIARLDSPAALARAAGIEATGSDWSPK